MTARAQSAKRALDDALRGLEKPERRDQATIALAKNYAARIDDNPQEIGKLGPLLLDCLRELRMTPKSRASVVKGSSGDSGKRSALDELRDRRERRATSVDSSTS